RGRGGGREGPREDGDARRLRAHRAQPPQLGPRAARAPRRRRPAARRPALKSAARPAAPRYLGARVKRLEDPRLLAGQGRFLDDIGLPGLVHAGFARRFFAHARLRAVDLARRAPGVLAALTGPDLARL